MIWLPKGYRELEKEVLKDASVDEAWKHFVHLVGLAPRLAGTENEKKQVEYYKKLWTAWGVPGKAIEYDTFVADGPTWGPEKSPNIIAEATVTYPEKRSLECNDRTGSTGPGGVEGDLVNIGGCTDGDIKQANVKGKITISYHPGKVEVGTFPDPNFNNLNYRLLKSLGALAHINVSWRPFIRQGAQIMQRISHGNATPEELENLVDLPVIEISKADGEHIRGLMNKGPVRVRVINHTLLRWLKGRMAYVEIPGTAEPEKFVMISGHHDAIGGSATCNSNGNALMLEVMRVLWKHRDKLKRSVRFLFWTGHEPYEFNTGIEYYGDEHFDDIRKNCILHCGVDTPFIAKAGLCPGAAGIRGKNSLQIRKFHEQVIMDVVPREHWDVEPTLDGFFPGDEFEGLSARGGIGGGTWNLGIPSMGTGKRNSKLSPYAHMIEDTLDKGGTPDLFLDHINIMLASLLRICNCPVLPLEFVGVAERCLEELKGHQKRAGGKYDLTSLINIAETLRREAQSLGESIAGLEKRYEAGGGKGLDGLFKEVNNALMRMSFILREASPSPLRPLADLAKLDPESSAFKALRTKIVRARNKLAATYSEAAELAAQTTSRIQKFSP